MKHAIKHEPHARHSGWNEPDVTFASEVVVLVACLAAIALAVSAITGRLDNIGAKLFAALGI